jgi:hypothetical protein
MARTKKSNKEYYQEVVQKYREAGEEWPASSRMIGAWAVRQGLVEAEPKSVIDQAASAIAAAMREEYVTDPQGRRVRKKHAVRETHVLKDGTHEQLVFWVDIEDARPEEMHAAFQQRRMQVLGDCRQLKTDVDSYNDNNDHAVHIQMEWDFSLDLVESEQPVEYPGLV